MPKDRFVRWGLRQSKLKRRLRNPYFQKSGNPMVRGRFYGLKSILKWLGVALAAVAIVAIPIEACTNDYFALSETVYEYPDLFIDRQDAVRAVVEAELAKPLLWYLDRKNFFLVPTGSIERAIGETGSYADVEAKRVFPRGLKIAVSPPKRVFMVMEAGEGAALVGADGIVIDILGASSSTPQIPSAIATSSLIRVTIEHDASSTLDIVMGKEIIPRNCATLITGVQDGTKRIGLTPTQYRIASDSTSITAMTDDGWKLLIDPIMSADDQIERLAAVLRDPRYKNRSKIDYIDVRYPERVYVKAK